MLFCLGASKFHTLEDSLGCRFALFQAHDGGAFDLLKASSKLTDIFGG